MRQNALPEPRIELAWSARLFAKEFFNRSRQLPIAALVPVEKLAPREPSEAAAFGRNAVGRGSGSRRDRSRWHEKRGWKMCVVQLNNIRNASRPRFHGRNLLQR